MFSKHDHPIQTHLYRDAEDNETSRLERELYEVQIKLETLKSQLENSKSLLAIRKNEVLKAELLLEAYNRELLTLQKESKSLRARNIDVQVENEGLKALVDVGKSQRDGSTNRQQLLNFDEVLKDILPKGVTVEMLLDKTYNLDKHAKS
ncbi:unnamed protein product [Dimorphilus gyrociliatus]|uniref:Uncharacterized protein n=1 Tax=Dimorphilus gyrociliatus TaxID=2664684 RepID=A0A7I8VR13_9ANNE|nr:unnamed protein product [Dimorphilus gyrociliatus]